MLTHLQTCYFLLSGFLIFRLRRQDYSAFGRIYGPMTLQRGSIKVNRTEFIVWLNHNSKSINAKYIRDMASRAARVERAFQAIDPDFSYENEYKRDKGASLLEKLSLEGRQRKGTHIALPIGTNQMAVIKAAAVWYVRYMDDTIGKKRA